MRRWLLNLHLYLGLACLPYVVLLGVSAILLNHAVGSNETVRWEQRVALSGAGDDRTRARLLRDALDLSGGVNVLPRSPGAPDTLRFKLYRPGRRYAIELGDDAIARVVETRTGLVGIVRSLHGLRSLEASRWGPSWGLYTELTSFALVFSIASGITLFWPRRAERAVGLGACALGLAAVAACAAALW